MNKEQVFALLLILIIAFVWRFYSIGKAKDKERID